MHITRFEPWGLMNLLQRDFEQLAGRRFALSNADENGNSVADYVPAVDVVEENDRFVLRADLPGVDPKDITISMENGALSLAGERHSEKNEKARVPAVEVMVMTPAIRDIIRDGGRTADVLKHMADGRKQAGSQTYRQHLEELVEAGLISPDSAKAAHALTKSSTLGKRGGKHAAAG